MDWFLYDNSLRLQRVNHNGSNVFQRKQKSVKFRKNPTQCIKVEEKLYLDYYHWYTLLNSDSFPASI